MIYLDYSRNDGETDLEYIKRLVVGKLVYKTIDADFEELSEKIFGEGNCYNSSEVRKRMYGMKHFIEVMEKDGINNISEDAIIKELELKKQELQKEKYKIQTEKLTLNQLLREEARFELFTERAVDAIKVYSNIPVNRQKIDFCENNDRSGMLFFADAHYNKELKILGLHGEIINEYSVDIFEKRMWMLLEKAVKIIKREGFDRINVMNLGDELDGLIHLRQLMTLKYGLVESTVKFAYFLARWLDELSNHVFVDYYSTEGNHTDLRLLSGKKGDLPNENLGEVIRVFVKEILKDNPNVILHSNHTNNIFTEVLGFNIMGIHGEEKNLQQAIRDFSFIYSTDIHYLITGHKHHANSINVGVGKGCIGVGSIIGIDDFSMQLKKVSNPSATFAVFEKNAGKTLEYTIYLDK